MRLRAMAAVSVLAVVTIAIPATPAYAGCGDLRVADATPVILPKDDSGNWLLARFGLSRLPARVNGHGVTVAVLDSGVKASHPALADRLVVGRDLLEGTDRTYGKEDCRGHGTAVASLIAGKPRPGFRGIAPGAMILPIRVNETEDKSSEEGRPTSDTKIAAGIVWAIQHNADVINISFAYTGKDADPSKHRVFADAVQQAIDKDVVVVAAVGNVPDAKDSFPANLPGVLGVGAINSDGARWENSTAGEFVDVSAPGGNVIAAWPAHDIFTQVAGTSFAAPVVSGTVALLKQLHPSWKNSDFVAQIVATTDPSLGGKASPAYGAGVVNPVRAVSDVLARGAAWPGPSAAAEVDDPRAQAAARDAAARHGRALWLALAVGALTVIVLFSSAILHNGARRRWRAAE